jgi:putative peptidoglycan lipid II flippase
MVKGFGINFFGILTSRVLGFLRDLLTASLLGATLYSDLFFIAFKLPNLFRRIFGEGAFTQAFLPALAHSRDPARFSYHLLKLFLTTLLLLSLLVTIGSPIVAKIVAIGFPQSAQELAAPLIGFNFWYLDLIFLATFFGALLQYREQFLPSAFAPALLNLSLIGALLIGAHLPPLQLIYWLSGGVILGGVLQLLLHLFFAGKTGILQELCRGASGPSPDLKPFFKQFLPAVWGNSTAQLSSFLDTWLATFAGAGGVSYLYYSNRLFQLPFALFGIALSTALFPKLTRLFRGGMEGEGGRLLRRSFWFLAGVLGFATGIGVGSSREIVELLFQRGAFTAADTQITSQLLSLYLAGLLPFGLAKVVTSYLYATRQGGVAARLTTLSLGVNSLLSLSLLWWVGLPALPLGTSAGGALLLLGGLWALPTGLRLEILRYWPGWGWLFLGIGAGFGLSPLFSWVCETLYLHLS